MTIPSAMKKEDEITLGIKLEIIQLELSWSHVGLEDYVGLLHDKAFLGKKNFQLTQCVYNIWVKWISFSIIQVDIPIESLHDHGFC